MTALADDTPMEQAHTARCTAVLAATLGGMQPAHADQVRISGSAYGEITFTGWDEIASVQPFGAAGLSQLNLWSGEGSNVTIPEGSISGAATGMSGTIGAPGPQAPIPGTGWITGSALDATVYFPGTASLHNDLDFAAAFVNQTGGASEYIIHGVASIWIEASSDLLAPATQSAGVDGFALFRLRSGFDISTLAFMYANAQGPAGFDRSEVLSLPFDLRVPANPGFAEIQITLSLSGSLSEVPAPAGTLLFAGSFVVAARRSRKCSRPV